MKDSKTTEERTQEYRTKAGTANVRAAIARAQATRHLCFHCEERPVIYGGVFCTKCQAEHEENMKEETR